MSILVSVIMPTYNRGYIIKRAIDSILNQTYKNIELIIVDDCSNDNTKDIIDSINDKRIIYHRLKKNSGANVARNIGIDLAKGELITFQDSDDVSFKTRINEEVELLKKENCDFVYCSFENIDGSKKTIMPKSLIKGNDKLKQLLLHNYITTECLLIKKEIIKKEKFDETIPRFQDWDLAIRLFSRNNGEHLNKVLVTQYLQKDSITKNPKKGEEALKIIINKYNDLMDEEVKAKIYCRIGTFQMLDNKDATYFLKLASRYKSLKYKIVYILYKLHLYKLLYSIFK